MPHSSTVHDASFEAVPLLHRGGSVAIPTYVTHFARADAAVREAQRLRYRVFVEEMGARPPATDAGLEADALDPYCEHLLIRHTATDQVVGTYRILTSDQARQAGGFCAAREFDLGRLVGLSARMIEVGRACIDPAHRNHRMRRCSKPCTWTGHPAAPHTARDPTGHSRRPRRPPLRPEPSPRLRPRRSSQNRNTFVTNYC